MKIPPYIERPTYLDRIMPFVGKDIIQVFTGQRRVGKSYMLFQLMERISSLDPGGRQIYINKELYEFASIRSGSDLAAYVEERRDSDSTTYLFIDELQDIEGFENALRSFQAEGGFEIYATGSNAKLLSGELATYLSGRYVEFEIYGLTYPEFLVFHSLDKGRESFESYMKFGDYLKSQKIKVSNNLVLDYLSCLATAFLVFRVNRVEIEGRKIFEIGEKYYFEDLGIRHALVGFRPMDIGKILENMVYMHLRASGYEIMVGKTGEREVDFVCEKNGEKLYVQVAYLLSDDKVRDREFGNLLSIPDNYPKMVVSMDELPEGDCEGIRHVHAMDFLTSFGVAESGAAK